MNDYYFTAVSAREIEVLIQCRVRNVAIPYGYAKKMKRDSSGKASKDGSLDWIDGRFANVMIIGGSSEHVYVDDYGDFLATEIDNYDYATQLEVGDPVADAEMYAYNASLTDADILPVISGNWNEGISALEGLDLLHNNKAESDYVALGFKGIKDRFDWVNDVRNLPREYIYHVFTGNEELFHKVYSHHSGQWAYGARAGKISSRVYKDNLDVRVGDQTDSNRNRIRYVCNTLTDDCEACGVRVDDVLNQDYDSILKMPIATYYRPLFREHKMFSSNFYC